ncbi:hypothetical protein G8O29_02930 [Rhodobacter sp. M37P]|uniref:Uncharacterized protein n=2 Tax=Rhodobacter calidifons TaxID=2715277 RepID=A0ABX0G3F8_9RHOB|nr:hypothetical protein [Rhodobacter calidifons]
MLKAKECSGRYVDVRAAASLLAFCVAIFPVVASADLAAGPVILKAYPAPGGHAPMLVQMDADRVRLITGLIAIEHDLLLGSLFSNDQLVSAEGSHFSHPRQETFPEISEALAKAGAPDLEPLLIDLENAGDRKTIDAAYVAALTGIKRTLEVLQPTEQEILHAVIATAQEAQRKLDPSGTTAVADYQEAWGLLMAARGKLDTLVFSRDPAIKTSATKAVLDFDEVLMLAPDPAAKAPVQFDPALIGKLVTSLEGRLSST